MGPGILWSLVETHGGHGAGDIRPELHSQFNRGTVLRCHCDGKAVGSKTAQGHPADCVVVVNVQVYGAAIGTPPLLLVGTGHRGGEGRVVGEGRGRREHRRVREAVVAERARDIGVRSVLDIEDHGARDLLPCHSLPGWWW